MIKPIAIYLPQFHPVEENNEWWGKGFTEWTNVTKSQPRFQGHYQPQLPSDLGFYDLRLAEARIAQEALAREYGISGFCYYHYWFNGRRMLQEPLDRKLRNPEETLPFMLCWANENWTRRWDGQDQEILLKQEYGLEDDATHMRYLCRNYFADERYIRIDGKPVFMIYKPGLFPDIARTIAVWREEAKNAGIGELFLGCFQLMNSEMDPAEVGFDFCSHFQPDYFNRPSTIRQEYKKPAWSLLRPKNDHFVPDHMAELVYDYETYVKKQLADVLPVQGNIRDYPCVVPGWDNSARRKDYPFILHDSTPEKYGQWLKGALQQGKWNKDDGDLIFLNAWNEWAEGNHLEPCQKWGSEYLKITKKILEEFNNA